MNEHDDHVKRMTEFLFQSMSHMYSYHHHKEAMAHAAILVMLGFVAAIAGIQWPPSWIPSFHLSARFIAFIGVSLVWYLLHLYILWQLRNRVIAAIYVSTYLKVLRSWATQSPSQNALKAWEQEPPKSHPIASFCNRALFPLGHLNMAGDDGLKGYPTVFVEEFLAPRTGATTGARTGARTGEIIVVCGSILLGLILAIKMWPWW
jgi:hypothetical protein